MHGEVIKQSTKEFGARAVDVGHGDGYHQVLNTDDKHMGIGFADIVLNDQTRSRTGRGGIEAWMIEFERTCAIDPRA